MTFNEIDSMKIIAGLLKTMNSYELHAIEQHCFDLRMGMLRENADKFKDLLK